MEKPVTVEQILTSRAQNLAELDRRQQVVRDFVCGVAKHHHPGMYLYGRPGTAKTHTVREALRAETQGLYTYLSGHVTPMGLFSLLRENPDDVIVLDDVGSLFKSPVALQILLAALDRPAGWERDKTRIVTYRRLNEEQKVAFRGGVICVSNLELHGAALLDAFKSRVHVCHYDPPDAQLGAVMLRLAERGWPFGAEVQTVSPAEAVAVAEHLIAEMARAGVGFDLRLFVNKALPDFQQWKDQESVSHWKDLVAAAVNEHLVDAAHADEPGPRAARKEVEHEIIHWILKQFPSRDGRLRAWVERTGKSERAFYRRRAELEPG